MRSREGEKGRQTLERENGATKERGGGGGGEGAVRGGGGGKGKGGAGRVLQGKGTRRRLLPRG
jgi:hypothetical protein